MAPTSPLYSKECRLIIQEYRIHCGNVHSCLAMQTSLSRHMALAIWFIHVTALHV